jgi:hypothetical protein
VDEGRFPPRDGVVYGRSRRILEVRVRFELDRGQLYGFTDRLNMDKEEALAQFLQMLNLLAITGLLFAIGHRGRRLGDRWARWWLAMAGVFFYLTIDESSRIHEMSIIPLQQAFGTSGPLFFAWLVVAIPLVLLFVALYVPFLRALDPWTRNRFLLAGLLYVSGTVGMEMLGGMWVEGNFFDSTYYYTFVPIEEIFEVSGQLLFLFTLLIYVGRTQQEITLRVMGASGAADAVADPGASENDVPSEDAVVADPR